MIGELLMPELVLYHKYALLPETVLSEIQAYDFRGASEGKNFDVARIGGYRYVKHENDTKEILAWQCNMADILNYDIKLPTIIQIWLDQQNRIEKIQLHKSFKGSQGIPCSYKYLNRKLQEICGILFRSDEAIIKDEVKTACRHTYELLVGACTLFEWCEEQGETDICYSEATAAYEDNGRIFAIDHTRLGEKTITTKIEVCGYKGNLQYNRYGAITACKNMEFEAWAIDETREEKIADIKTIEASSTEEFKIKIMKIFSKYWLSASKRLGVRRRFYFSQIWPTTFFGIMSQMFAFSVFSNSYSYFQHCIRGLQKNETSCACIGVCENLEECTKYFSDFKLEDLF